MSDLNRYAILYWDCFSLSEKSIQGIADKLPRPADPLIPKLLPIFSLKVSGKSLLIKLAIGAEVVLISFFSFK